jgi:tetratricopeptide (TPR) repeat protein
MSDSETKYVADPLTRLAIKHGTDKWGPHFYTPLYHALFSPLRDRALRLLEIGVGGYGFSTVGGASLAMWAEYFSNALVTGIDIVEKRLALDPRIKVFRGSQDDPIFLNDVCAERGPFDIIIDDGSHVPKQVAASFNILFPSLVEGGMYVIEDMQTAFWPQFGGSMHGGDTVKLVRTIIECLNHAEISAVGQPPSLPPFARQIKSLRAFHNVLVVDKGDNCEPSNSAYDLNNPHAQNAVTIMEQQLQSVPTAEGMANLVDLYVRGGNLTKAKEITERALSLWPANLNALIAGYRTATARNDTTAKIDYLERILQIEPDNAAVQQAMQQARGEKATSRS